MNTSYQITRVSDHFPSVKKECKEPAARFFYCFSNESQRHKELLVRTVWGRSKPCQGTDKDVGFYGLNKCASLMADYDECMKKALANQKK